MKKAEKMLARTILVSKMWRTYHRFDMTANISILAYNLGGPLVSFRNDNEPILIGVVSWGRGCGQPKSPGVYARVTAVRSWIKSVSGI